jgi:hypothetical protein
MVETLKSAAGVMQQVKYIPCALSKTLTFEFDGDRPLSCHYHCIDCDTVPTAGQQRALLTKNEWECFFLNWSKDMTNFQQTEALRSSFADSFLANLLNHCSSRFLSIPTEGGQEMKAFSLWHRLLVSSSLTVRLAAVRLTPAFYFSCRDDRTRQNSLLVFLKSLILEHIKTHPEVASTFFKVIALLAEFSLAYVYLHGLSLSSD